MDPSVSDERRATIDIRLGALLGYPRSGTMAWLNRAPRAARSAVCAQLTDKEQRFIQCTTAASREGFAEGVAQIRGHARAFAEVYGDIEIYELPNLDHLG